MKKLKLLLFLMVLFGLNVFSKAQTREDLIIGDASLTTYNLPANEYYKYSFSQQIFTAEEMQNTSGQILSVSFKQADNRTSTRNIEIYLVNTSKEVFANTFDWEIIDPATTPVFDGTVTYPAVNGEWLTFTFDTPFEYTGGNLLLCLCDKTGNCVDNEPSFYTYSTGTTPRAMYYHNDIEYYSPENMPTYSAQFHPPTGPFTGSYENNHVKFNMTMDSNDPVTVTPHTIQLGARPNGAWMRPVEVTINSESAVNITSIETSNEYFQLSQMEFPVELTPETPVDFEVNHTEGEGEITAQLTLTYEESKAEKVVEMTAFAYNPVESDVWEMAKPITLPFTETPNVSAIYNNYLLPGTETDGKDVVYEINFDEEVFFTANVEGPDGKIAIYSEDFNGKEGPMADNSFFVSESSNIIETDIPAGKYYLVASSTGDFVVNASMTEPEGPAMVKYVEATELSSDTVAVEWNIRRYYSGVEDFETGDFSANEWINDGLYPWIITENAYEGSFAMKSSNENISNSFSSIEIEIEAKFDGIVSFYQKVSSEATFDNACFYIDDEQKSVVSGYSVWQYVEVPVTKGVHTYKWSYEKDGDLNIGDDNYHVDNISFCAEPEAFSGGWIYYDNGIFTGSVGTGMEAPFYWGISFPDTEMYSGYVLSKLSLYDAYPDEIGPCTANIYFGGTTAPATLVATKDFELTGTQTMIEVVLDNPVVIDPSQPLWITFYVADIAHPAAGGTFASPNADWFSLDGVEWKHTSSPYAWMVRGYLENAKGDMLTLGTENKQPEFKGGASTVTELSFKAAEQTVEVAQQTDKSSTSRGLTFDSYNLYVRNIFGTEVELLKEQTVDTTYFETAWNSFEPGVYQWGVSALYGNGTQSENLSESEILWSNKVDKDMYTTVTVSASTDNEDPIIYTRANFVNLIEEGIDYTVNFDENGTYTWDSFRKGTYELTISKMGYTTNVDKEIVEIWEPSSFNAILSEIIEPATDLYVSPTGWAMWTGKTIVGDVFKFDFDDGTLNGWQNIDADGDGEVWQTSVEANFELPGYNGTEAYIMSNSYMNYVGPLYPDNYLVTTDKYMIGDASKLVFYVCAQDATSPYEHYGVAISTEGNTSADDFNTIWEETLVPEKGSTTERNTTERGTKDPSPWVQKIVDLSDYAGKEVYIALRHFNCSDQFILNIDEVSLENTVNNDKAFLGYKVYIDNNLVAENLEDTYFQHENLVEGNEYTTKVVASYTSTDSETIEYTWTYVPESMFMSATNFTAELINQKVVLNWDMPSSDEYEPLGVMIYHNDVLVTDKVIADTTYTDRHGENGDEYCIKVVYGGDIDVSYYAMSEPTCAEVIYEMTCTPPINLYGEETWTNGSFGASLIWQDAEDTEESTVIHYNIYRGTSTDNFEKVGETVEKLYFDEVEVGTYYYQVTAVYVENDEECESEPATSIDPTLNYVTVDVTAINENDVNGMKIYPNPTKDILNITAENMQRITISNAFGQIVYDKEVLSDHELIEMSQYESGVYVIHVMTDKGLAVERIIVTK